MRAAALLYSQGFGTRRACAGLVAAGRVTVGGRVLGPDDEVPAEEGLSFSVDGLTWPFHTTALVLLHKPAGFECSQRPRHHPSVLSLLPAPLRARGV